MRELFIESDSFEIRTALRADGRVVELQRESTDHPSVVGGIFHGKVRRVVSGIGSAFLDIGLERDAFLQLEDLGGRRDERIDDLLEPGERMLVQVVRDRPGKGARVSTRLALPGRSLVLLPTSDGVVVSRRLVDPEQVQERYESVLAVAGLLDSGWIVRTVGATAESRQVEIEARLLTEAWQRIAAEYRESKHPHALHLEPHLAIRTVRDLGAIDRVTVQGPVADEVAGLAHEWLPEVEVDTDDSASSLYARVGLDVEIDKLQKPWVTLPSGGSLVIETTEALVSIDVNSGSDVGDGDFEDLALTTNLEAVSEIARQLRARGLGGLIAIDFIDLRREANRMRLLEALRRAVEDDPQGVRVGGMSRFGLVDLTRRRPGVSYFEQSQRSCPTCSGRGKVASIRALRSEIRHRLAGVTQGGEVEVRLAPETAARLGDLSGLGMAVGAELTVVEDPLLAPSEIEWRDP